MLKCDYQINAVLECISIYADIGSDLRLNEADVKRLNDYIDSQNKKIEELRSLVNYQANEIVNLTEQINSIEL